MNSVVCYFVFQCQFILKYGTKRHNGKAWSIFYIGHLSRRKYLRRIKLCRHAQIEHFILNKALTTVRLNNFGFPLTIE